MRKFFRVLWTLFKVVFKLALLAAVAGGVYYAVRQMMGGQDSARGPKGSGLIPAEPIRSLDEAPLGGKISEELLKILVCPEDKGPLELVDDGKYLLNPRNGYRYPIRNGIPVMLIEEGRKHRVPVNAA